MKKWKKILFATMPVVTVAITIPTVLTSCSSTNSQELGVVKYNSKQGNNLKPTIRANGDIPTSMDLQVVDPNLSDDAKSKANETFKKRLDVSTLQNDFDKVLKKFYEVVEWENNSIDQEAKVVSIKVISVDSVNLTARLEVKYKVETDINDEENVQYEIQEKTINLTPAFATNTEMQKITKMLKGDDQEVGNLDIDVEDLLELYVGDPDDNEKSIFEQAELITQNSKYGGLLGYGLDLTALQYTPKVGRMKASTNVDLTKQQIFAPSYEIRDFYVPDIETVITSSGLDLTFDYDAIKVLNRNDIISKLSGQNSITELISLLKDKKTPADKIASVYVLDLPEKQSIAVLVQLASTDEIDSTFNSLITLAIPYDWLVDGGQTPPTTTPGTGTDGSENNGNSSTDNGDTNQSGK